MSSLLWIISLILLLLHDCELRAETLQQLHRLITFWRSITLIQNWFWRYRNLPALYLAVFVLTSHHWWVKLTILSSDWVPLIMLGRQHHPTPILTLSSLWLFNNWHILHMADNSDFVRLVILGSSDVLRVGNCHHAWRQLDEFRLVRLGGGVGCWGWVVGDLEHLDWGGWLNGELVGQEIAWIGWWWGHLIFALDRLDRLVLRLCHRPIGELSILRLAISNPSWRVNTADLWCYIVLWACGRYVCFQSSSHLYRSEVFLLIRYSLGGILIISTSCRPSRINQVSLLMLEIWRWPSLRIVTIADVRLGKSVVAKTVTLWDFTGWLIGFGLRCCVD